MQRAVMAAAVSGLAAGLIFFSDDHAAAQQIYDLSLDQGLFATFSPDETRMAVADDRSVVVIDVTSGREIDRLSGGAAGISGLAWVGNRDVLVARDGVARVSSEAGPVAGLQLFRPGVNQPTSELAPPGCAAVSGAGRLAAAACGDGLVLVGMEDGAGSVVAYGGLGRFQTIAITPDGGMVIAAHRPGISGNTDPSTAVFLEIAVDWPVHPPMSFGEMPLDAEIIHLAASPGGAVATLANGSVARLTIDGVATISADVVLPDSAPLGVMPDGRFAIGDFRGGNVLDLQTGAILADTLIDLSPDSPEQVADSGIWAVGPVSRIAWVGPTMGGSNDEAAGVSLILWTAPAGGDGNGIPVLR